MKVALKSVNGRENLMVHLDVDHEQHRVTLRTQEYDSVVVADYLSRGLKQDVGVTVHGPGRYDLVIEIGAVRHTAVLEPVGNGAFKLELQPPTAAPNSRTPTNDSPGN